MNTINFDTIKEKFNSTLETLKQQRDELRVQLNLGTAEAKEELAKAEAKFEEFEKKFTEKKDTVTAAASEASEDLSAAFELMTGEISKTFENLKNKLQ
jgi:cytochrome c556